MKLKKRQILQSSNNDRNVSQSSNNERNFLEPGQNLIMTRSQKNKLSLKENEEIKTPIKLENIKQTTENKMRNQSDSTVSDDECLTETSEEYFSEEIDELPSKLSSHIVGTIFNFY